MVASVTAANLRQALAECVHPTACIVTDELNVYPSATEGFEGGHKSVKHGDGEYVKYEADGFAVHTNTAEGVFSLLKRGIYGVYHNVSPEHLHRYCSEFEFRYNNRHVEDGERTVRAIREMEGRRLALR